MIDFHNHLMPAVDDGAASLDETRRSLELFAAQGFDTVVVTPHFRASLQGTPAAAEEYLGRVDAAWEQVRTLAAAEFAGLRVERGMEVALDSPALDLSDPRVRLAGTLYVLLEFPFLTVPPNTRSALFELRMQGYTPVIAHPERYVNLQEAGRQVAEWREPGALIQVNAGSLLGRYGQTEARRAWELLRLGLVDFVCSDYHGRGSLRSAGAREAVTEAGGEKQAELLFEVNARRILSGATPLPVAPLARRRRTFWSRWFGSRETRPSKREKQS